MPLTKRLLYATVGASSAPRDAPRGVDKLRATWKAPREVGRRGDGAEIGAELNKISPNSENDGGARASVIPRHVANAERPKRGDGTAENSRRVRRSLGSVRSLPSVGVHFVLTPYPSPSSH
ncbi:unnamed protein product [Lampetra fluviatilis]